jgi:beta-lactamase class A
MTPFRRIVARRTRHVERGAVAAGVLLALLSVPPLHAQNEKAADLRAKLSDRLNTIAKDLDGVMGFTVVDLTSGDRFERLPNEVFPTASTIKLAILYELFRQADERKIQLDASKTLERRSAVGGSGILNDLTTPTLSLRDYAMLMVVLSDNTATNVLIDVVGMDNVTKRLASLGLKATRLRRKMIDMEAARRGDENVSTPAEIARLLDVIHRGEGLSTESRDALTTILRKSKSSPMRTAIPPGTPVANKPGTLEGVEVDAGIVYVAGRPYVQAIMTTYLNENAAGNAAIQSASQAAFEYFSRLAKSSEYGRSIR